MRLGEVFPDLRGRASASTSLYEKEGTTIIENFSLRQHIAGNWALFFSHPADFTPVCTTELAEAVLVKERFAALNCNVVGFSCDEAESHVVWAADILRVVSACRKGELRISKSCGEPEKGNGDDGGSPGKSGSKDGQPALLPFPIMADPSRQMAQRLGILDPRDEAEAKNCRAAGKPVPPSFSVRSCFFISPDMRIEATILYPAVTGRSFPEILRVLQALQLSKSTTCLVTPVNWQPGGPCIIQPTMDDEQALKIMQDSEEGARESKDDARKAVKDMAATVNAQNESSGSGSSPGATPSSQSSGKRRIEHFALPSGKAYLRFLKRE